MGYCCCTDNRKYAFCVRCNDHCVNWLYKIVMHWVDTLDSVYYCFICYELNTIHTNLEKYPPLHPDCPLCVHSRSIRLRADRDRWPPAVFQKPFGILGADADHRILALRHGRKPQCEEWYDHHHESIGPNWDMVVTGRWDSNIPHRNTGITPVSIHEYRELTGYHLQSTCRAWQARLFTYLFT